MSNELSERICPTHCGHDPMTHDFEGNCARMVPGVSATGWVRCGHRCANTAEGELKMAVESYDPYRTVNEAEAQSVDGPVKVQTSTSGRRYVDADEVIKRRLAQIKADQGVDEPELLPCPCMTEFGHAPHKPGMCPDGERFTCECGESLRAEARVLWNKIREFGSYDKPAIEAIVVALTRSRPTVEAAEIEHEQRVDDEQLEYAQHEAAAEIRRQALNEAVSIVRQNFPIVNFQDLREVIEDLEAAAAPAPSTQNSGDEATGDN